MEWTRILAYITGSVDQELLLRNEYLAAENRSLYARSEALAPQYDGYCALGTSADGAGSGVGEATGGGGGNVD